MADIWLSLCAKAFGVLTPTGQRYAWICGHLSYSPEKVYVAEEWRQVNACMVFGYVLLSRELVKTLPSDSVEGIIAHEVGHMRLGHFGKAYDISNEFAADEYAVKKTRPGQLMEALLRLRAHSHSLDLCRRVVRILRLEELTSG